MVVFLLILGVHLQDMVVVSNGWLEHAAEVQSFLRANDLTMSAPTVPTGAASNNGSSTLLAPTVAASASTIVPPTLGELATVDGENAVPPGAQSAAAPDAAEWLPFDSDNARPYGNGNGQRNPSNQPAKAILKCRPNSHPFQVSFFLNLFFNLIIFIPLLCA